MQLGLNNSKASANRTAVAALVLAISATSVGQIAFAQNATNAGSTGSQSSTLGTETDSLLPPEVVPLDPAVANAAAVQAAKSQSQTLPAGAVPGLVDNQSNNTGMISAREFRKDAMNSLYNQGQLPQLQQQGGVSFNPMNPGQGSMMNSPYSSPYADTTMANSQPPQSQTLTGGSRNTPKSQDIRRGGLTNTASGLAAMGMTGFMGYGLYRPNATSLLMGVGMWSLMTTGFGTRNGFRL
ncbi:MAG TPA: hypothetical protein V6D22_10645 [Candidatus Obscuribacterales bacterium]